MLNRFIRRFVYTSLTYVRIRPELLSVYEVSTATTFQDIPLLAITKGKRKRLLAFGTQAESKARLSGKDYELVNGFDHPRSIISDFTIAEKTLQHFLSNLYGKRFKFLSPVIVMHPLEKTEGGLTQVEIRALQEIALSAGARNAVVWTGQELTQHNFTGLEFPGDHWHPKKPDWVKS